MSYPTKKQKCENCHISFIARVYFNGKETAKLCEKCRNAKKMREEYYPKHKDKIIKYNKRWIKDNPDKKKQYYTKNNNLEETKKRKTEWVKDNPEKIAVAKEKNRQKRNMRIKVTDDRTITKETKQELLKKQNNKCNLCLTPLKLNKKGQVHLDHCVALLLDKKPEMCGIHSLCNIQYLCQRCSLRKGKKMDLVFGSSVIPASIRAKADWDYIFNNHIEPENSWELYCLGKYEVHLRATDKKKYKVPLPKWIKK